MVIDRRQLLGALLSALAIEGSARAEIAGDRLFLSCRMDAENNASVSCFDAQGRDAFSLSLPARGHDVTCRPLSGQVVAFARRPGNWFVVIDADRKQIDRAVHAPEGRHLYGHGAFSHDGRILYVTENDIATGDGVIGCYDASDGYRRFGEFPSGGIGPHDIVLKPDGVTLAVANGGLRTHPDTGRETLNPGDLRPSLAVIDTRSGAVLERHELDRSLRQLSIRHLAVRRDGLVAFGCQYEGSPEDAPPLLGLLKAGSPVELLTVDDDAIFRMRNYVGSVAFDDAGRALVATSPRGGAALVIDMDRRALARSVRFPDVCGAAATGDGAFLLTSGNSGVMRVDAAESAAATTMTHWIWDNHVEILKRT